jgi:hypothetical protein
MNSTDTRLESSFHMAIVGNPSVLASAWAEFLILLQMTVSVISYDQASALCYSPTPRLFEDQKKRVIFRDELRKVLAGENRVASTFRKIFSSPAARAFGFDSCFS